MRRILAMACSGLAAVAVALAALGSARDWHVVTVTRTADADRAVLWELWADVPGRVEWDRGLDRIEIDGPFEEGATGRVEVEGQDPVGFEVVEAVPRERYTDRFSSLLWTHTDWHHAIRPNGDGTYDVTWRLEARGPMALVSLPVLKAIFGEEVPVVVADYVALAEARSR